MTPAPHPLIPTRPRRLLRAQRAGLTTIELLIALALVVGMMGLAMYGLGVIGGATASAEALKLSGRVRYVYGQAATRNQVFQLRIDLDNNTYTAEAIESDGPLSRDELEGVSKAVEDAAVRSRERAARIDEEDEQFAGALARSPVGGPLFENTELPEGIAFLGVMTSHHTELQTEGVATINFFPSGLVEQSIIYIGQVKTTGSGDDDDPLTRTPVGDPYTVIISPLTGHTEVVSERVEVDEAFFQPEED